jgi:8-oxo-dGTP pyrophosphatase MutT (NUDIX family)
MAQSPFPTRTISSEQFIESCGAVLFDLSYPQEKKVCLVNYLKKKEWYLAKGRRNIGESRKDAAIREVMEETGFRCHLYPVTMITRAQPMDADQNAPDDPRKVSGLIEPFMFTMRVMDPTKVKFIWWYVAALDDGAEKDRLPGEPEFKPEFFSLEKAMEKLTFQSDRDVLRKAIEILESTLPS